MPKISRRTAIGIFGAPLCSALAQPTSPTRARISLNGDVMPKAGDMQGWSAPVQVGTRGIKLEISEVIQ